eukprot:2974823-Amphidinium_carterae.1
MFHCPQAQHGCEMGPRSAARMYNDFRFARQNVDAHRKHFWQRECTKRSLIIGSCMDLSLGSLCFPHSNRALDKSRTPGQKRCFERMRGKLLCQYVSPKAVAQFREALTQELRSACSRHDM